MTTGVSIIVCCYNSAHLLEETLRCLSVQLVSCIPCEVIVVDNASTDHTADLAQKAWDDFGRNDIQFKVVYQPVSGLSHARKKGIESAAFEYLIFCDDDNRLEKNYARYVFELFSENPDTAILGGWGSAEFENSAKPAWFDNFYHGYAVGKQGEETAFLNSVYGAGMAIRKNVANEITGRGALFLSGRQGKGLTAGDDSEICFRARLMGYRVMYSPKLIFTHFLTERRLSWNYLKRLHSGFSKGFVVLNLYDRVLTGQGSGRLPLFYWLKKGIYYWAIFIKYWPKHYRAYKKGEGTVEELRHTDWKNIAASYFSYNFKTVSLYRKIAAFKKI